MSSCPKAELAGAFWSLPVPTAVSLSPSCSCLMAPMALALILGSCLVAVSRAKHLPRPSLSLHPSQGVSLGDSVTLRCHLPSLAARVMLYQNRQWRTEKEKEKGQTTVEFSFLNTKWTDMGVYQCQYRVLDPPGTSEISDPVELLVTDPSYPQPGISLSPEEQVRTGTNVTIQCWNQGYQGTIFLHKDGHSAPVQRQDPDGIGDTRTCTPRWHGAAAREHVGSSGRGLCCHPRVHPRPHHLLPPRCPPTPDVDRCLPQNARGRAAPGQCLCQPTPNPNLPLGSPNPTREPQSLPMGSPQDTQTQMAYHNIMCTPKSSPLGHPICTMGAPQAPHLSPQTPWCPLSPKQPPDSMATLTLSKRTPTPPMVSSV
ncbi:uncharacterized protein LOC110390986 isoform X3 [Numida meleagris]|uniref:uncharacterized protein LOC110390986 isoform X3 n=1 Tax=Numida meleagris TaxID=8996 RepID=UPI000B3E36C4|nr:uncharacterized protein LOC110390986 isoform X3 [Numida meleagris]